MKRKWWVCLGVGLVVLTAGVVWGQLKAVRDDAGDTAYQSIAGEGQLIEGTMDAYGRLWVNVGADSTLTAPVAKTPTHLAAVIIGTPTTPLVLAADGTFFTVATLQAGRAAAANASLISITGSTSYATQRGIEMAPGDERELRPPAGTKWDLNDFLIDGVNTDDGVRITYIAP